MNIASTNAVSDLPAPPGWLMRQVFLPIFKVAPPVRGAMVVLKRGNRCFTLRRGTRVIIAQAEHQSAAEAVSAMFETHGYPRHATAGFQSISEQEVKQDGWRNQHVICIGGPDQNPLTAELVTQEFLQHVSYHPGAGEGTMSRAFVWRNRLFTGSSSQDYALIAVRRSPFNPKRWVAMFFGFGKMGTLGATRAFCHPDYQELRRQLTQQYSSVDGSLEALVSVQHNGTTISRITQVELLEGTPIAGDTRHSLQPYEEPLRKLYHSLLKHPPLVRIPKLVHTCTVLPEFDVRFETSAQWERHEDDILIRGTSYNSDAPLADWSALAFAVNVESEDHEIVFMPAIDNPREKSFVLFPIPPLRSDSKPITVRTSATWPRTLANLQRVGGRDHLTFTTPVGVVGTIESLQINLCFGTPGLLYEVSETFSVPGHKPRTVQLHGTDVHSITLPNAPAVRIRFEIKRLK